MLTTASADLRRWFRPSSVVVAVAACVYLATASASGQRTDVFVESRDHPAIAYGSSPVHDAVTALNDRLRQGTAHLAFDAETGYLKSTLAALLARFYERYADHAVAVARRIVYVVTGRMPGPLAV